MHRQPGSSSPHLIKVAAATALTSTSCAQWDHLPHGNTDAGSPVGLRLSYATLKTRVQKRHDANLCQTQVAPSSWAQNAHCTAGALGFTQAWIEALRSFPPCKASLFRWKISWIPPYEKAMHEMEYPAEVFYVGWNWFAKLFICITKLKPLSHSKLRGLTLFFYTICRLQSMPSIMYKGLIQLRGEQ